MTKRRHRRARVDRMSTPGSTVSEIVSIAGDVAAELDRLRTLVARLGEDSGPGLFDEWRIAQAGLFGPDGVIETLTVHYGSSETGFAAPERDAQRHSQAA